jgi:hypothetical protein
MDPLTIILATAALALVVGLAFISGVELGRKNGIYAARLCERNLANLRVNAVLAAENKRKPRAARRNRK